MKPNNSISRSPINDSKVVAQDFPKSGFNLAYRSYKDFVLGRLHVGGFHHVMPGDKFSGMNHGEFTLNQLVQGIPMLSPVSISQHNFLVTYRSIDTTFEDGQTPTKLNGMSASWHTPKFRLSTVVDKLLTDVYNLPTNWFAFGATTFDESEPLSSASTDTDLQQFISAIQTMQTSAFSAGGLYKAATFTDASNLYLLDALRDAYDFSHDLLNTIVFDGSLVVGDAQAIILDALLTPFVGRGSLICSLGYNYLRKYDLYSGDLAAVVASQSVLIGKIDDIQQCEYGIRAYIAVWQEHYRDYNLEPRSTNMPWYRTFGGTSIVNAQPLWLLNRIRSWSPDVFTSSLPDDPSRHVFAPLFDSSETRVSYLSGNNDYLNSEDFSGEIYDTYDNRNIKSYTIEYTDSLTGNTTALVCPIPKSVNDSLTGFSITSDVYALDLLTLRRSQMLEQYLKRNFYFGDEYADRLLAHYGSELSDYRINRPQVLSSSVDVLNNQQTMSTVGTAQSSVGERTANATGQSSNDGYSSFAEEFGIVINMISFVPSPMYAGATMQNFLDTQTDFPLPEFANQNDEFGRVIEVATSGLKKSNTWDAGCFGHYPAYHAYRARVDHVQDSFLDSKQNWTFRRFFGMDNVDRAPKLNYQFIHCRPNLDMFIDKIRLNGQLYGWINHEFYAERVLPTPTEYI